MPRAYQHKPCRVCGGEKEPDSQGRIGGWYCTKCEKGASKKYDRNVCGSKADDHVYWNCLDCRRIRRNRQREAAARGTATRARNNALWKKPFNAEKFWQSRAHAAVQVACKRGLLPQLKDGDYACTDCGNPALEYDHRDYGRPLDVQPVCRSCNHKRGTAKWPSAADYAFKRIGALVRRMDKNTALAQAIKIVGNQQQLADVLGIKSPSITEWHRRKVPAERCIAIEEATGGAITRQELRPDIFGEALAKPAEQGSEPSKSEGA